MSREVYGESRPSGTGGRANGQNIRIRSVNHKNVVQKNVVPDLTTFFFVFKRFEIKATVLFLSLVLLKASASRGPQRRVCSFFAFFAAGKCSANISKTKFSFLHKHDKLYPRDSKIDFSFFFFTNVVHYLSRCAYYLYFLFTSVCDVLKQ